MAEIGLSLEQSPTPETMKATFNNPKYYLENIYQLIKQKNYDNNNHYEFILQNGIFYEATYKELINSPQEHFYPKYCYYNAYTLAKASKGEIIYVEGFAALSNMPICVPHAWGIIQKTQQVVDPTWRFLIDESSPNIENLYGYYYGVPLPLEIVEKVYQWYRENTRTDSYCVFVDNQAFYSYLKKNNLLFSQFLQIETLPP